VEHGCLNSYVKSS